MMPKLLDSMLLWPEVRASLLWLWLLSSNVFKINWNINPHKYFNSPTQTRKKLHYELCCETLFKFFTLAMQEEFYIPTQMCWGKSTEVGFDSVIS